MVFICLKWICASLRASERKILKNCFKFPVYPNTFYREKCVCSNRGVGNTNTSNNMSLEGKGTVWFQKEFVVSAKKRGCHLITDEILAKAPEIQGIKVGVVNIHIKHTSASLCLNENWDPDVRVDMEMMINKLIPESTPFKHSCEGPDDMPAHVKAAFIGTSVSIPITNGKLNLGTWQGVWLCEHRNRAGGRTLVATINGAKE